MAPESPDGVRRSPAAADRTREAGTRLSEPAWPSIHCRPEQEASGAIPVFSCHNPSPLRVGKVSFAPTVLAGTLHSEGRGSSSPLTRAFAGSKPLLDLLGSSLHASETWPTDPYLRETGDRWPLQEG